MATTTAGLLAVAARSPALSRLKAHAGDDISEDEEPMKLLVQWHQAALQIGDTDGAQLMLNYLWQVIGLHLDGLGSIHLKLLSFLEGRVFADESEKAWAAYHVGVAAQRARAPHLALSWLEEALALAKTDALSFEILIAMEEASRGSNINKNVEYSELLVEVANRLGNCEDRVLSFYRLGVGLISQGFMARAQYLLTEIGSLIPTQLVTESDYFVRTLYHNLCGMILQEMGEHEDAYYVVKQAMEDLQKVSDGTRVLQRYLTDNNYTSKGNVSWQKFEVALEVASQLSMKKQFLRRKLGIEPDESDKILELQLAADLANPQVESVASENDELRNLFLKIDRNLEENMIEEAEACGAEALQLASLKDHDQYKSARVRALGLLAKITYTYHEHDFHSRPEAFEIVNNFLSEAERLALHTDMTEYLNLLRDRAYYVFQHSQGEAAAVLESTVRPFSLFLEIERRMSSSGEARIQLLEGMKDFFRQIQSTFLRMQPSDVKRALVWAEKERARVLLHQTVERHSTTSKENVDLVAAFDEDDGYAWQEIESICKVSGEETVFLIYTRPGTHVFSYFLHTGDDLWGRAVVVGPGIDLDLYVQATINAIIKDDAATRRHYLQLFYMILIRPWDEELEKIKPKRLIIIPTEELSQLPFAALLKTDAIDGRDILTENLDDEEDLEYLIERYEISVSQSLRMFKFCEQLHTSRQQKREECAQKLALVVGNPAQDLEYAQEEAESVNEFLQQLGFQVTHLEAEGATKQHVMDSLPKSDWVHFSTHGIVNRDFPQGALRLAAAAETHADNIADNITAYMATAVETHAATFIGSADITAQALSTTTAVLLSACKSGLGKVRGEGILGLPRSFHLAGVPTCVATLWNVDDEFTNTLVLKLYEKLGEGMQMSRALQETMKYFIELEDEWGGQVHKRNVRLWGGLFISGSPSALLV